jgi:hypothetical protein
MKKRVRVQPTNPYYSNEPAVSRKMIADQGITQNASLGNSTPKMVDKKPGKLSGLAGFQDKHRPKQKNITQITKAGFGKPPSPSKSPQQGRPSTGKPHKFSGLRTIKSI